jgi:hypothetical protein
MTAKKSLVTPWEYHVALLPIRFRDEITPETGRPCLVQNADKAERKRVLEALLELPWLPTGIRRATMKVLGRSLRKQNDAVGRARSATYRLLVSEVEARMLAHRERPPRGSFRIAAIEEVAEAAGMTAEAIERRTRTSPRRSTRRRKR